MTQTASRSASIPPLSVPARPMPVPAGAPSQLTTAMGPSEAGARSRPSVPWILQQLSFAQQEESILLGSPYGLPLGSYLFPPAPLASSSSPQELCMCCSCCPEHSSPSSPLPRLLLVNQAPAPKPLPQGGPPNPPATAATPTLFHVTSCSVSPEALSFWELVPFVPSRVPFPSLPLECWSLSLLSQGLAYSECSINICWGLNEFCN